VIAMLELLTRRITSKGGKGAVDVGKFGIYELPLHTYHIITSVPYMAGRKRRSGHAGPFPHY
jgi:hypothetical protein